jgi:putative transposase
VADRQSCPQVFEGGSGYTARDTRNFACDIKLLPRTTSISSPQSNGMAEAFVRSLKCDYVRVEAQAGRSDSYRTADKMAGAFPEVYPQRAPGYRSPRE